MVLLSDPKGPCAEGVVPRWVLLGGVQNSRRQGPLGHPYMPGSATTKRTVPPPPPPP